MTAPLQREAWTAYVVPQCVCLLAALTGNAVVITAVLLILPWAVPANWLLSNWLGISFINFAQFTNVPWVGLLPTYYLLWVAHSRGLSRAQQRALSTFRIEILALGLIGTSFFLSRNDYWFATALKSSLQLSFILLASIFMRRVDEPRRCHLAEQIRVVLPTHLVIYGTLTLLVWQFGGSDERYGALLGPQVGAFSLCLVFCFLWLGAHRRVAFFCLLLIALTGSRTFIGICLLMVFAPLATSRSQLSTKVLAACGMLSIVGALLALLPAISGRFAMNDEFYGTLLGRLVNYDSAVEHISGARYFGEGMGSFVQVLESWIPEYFEYYVRSGDTTVLHNEYLRIGMELGACGLFITAVFVARALTRTSKVTRTLTVVMLMGSLTENTLAAFSTSMLTLLLLASASDRDAR